MWISISNQLNVEWWKVNVGQPFKLETRIRRLELTHRWEIRKNNCDAQFQTNLILEVEIEKKNIWKIIIKKTWLNLGQPNKLAKWVMRPGLRHRR